MPARSPEARARLDELRARIYEDRKVRQVCVHCEGPLAPDDGVRCAGCVEFTLPAATAYRSSERGVKVRRKNQQDYVMRRYNAGLCVLCCLPRDQWPAPTALSVQRSLSKETPPQKCPACAAEHTAYTKRRNELKRAGVTDIADARRKKSTADKLAAAIAARAAIDSYQPIDEIIGATRARILRGVARFDWTSSDELFLALGVEEREERATFAKSLSRLVKAGAVDRRGAPGRYEFAISNVGRAELRRILEEKSC